MRVDIDPSGRDEQPVGIDGLARGGGEFADLGDLAVTDRDVAGEGGSAGAVDDGAAFDDAIEHGFPEFC